MTMATSSPGKTRFFEGGNNATLVAAPIALGVALIFYHKLVVWVAPLQIQTADVYSYVFNLFAIEFGALVGTLCSYRLQAYPVFGANKEHAYIRFDRGQYKNYNVPYRNRDWGNICVCSPSDRS